MKSKFSKIMCAGLSVCLAIGVCGTAAIFGFANSEKDKEKDKDKKPETVVSETEKGVSKDETVYVIAEADGSVKKIIVSDWIKNTLNNSTITDKTDLTNIENVKGDESFSVNGDNMKVWDAQGNDIYYRGDIKKELPVNISLSYLLDGKKVNPEEIAGKSGHVTLRFDYKNNQYETVKIDGKDEKIYVPFAMLTGTILDLENFKNVTVTNGKILNDGDRAIVMGIAFPGMQHNLNIDKNDLEIPDYIEIEADVKDFKLETTVTLATNGLLNEIDTSSLNDTDDIDDKLKELSGAMDALMNGSSKLYDGLSSLLDKSTELVNGINKLADGVKQLKDGIGTLDGGMADLQGGINDLNNGLSALSSNSGKLNEASKQIFNHFLLTANSELNKAGIQAPQLTAENYSKVLSGIIASLDKDAVYQQVLNEVTKQVEAKRPAIEEQVKAGVLQQVSAQVTEEVKKAVEAQVTLGAKDLLASQIIPLITGMSKNDYEQALQNGLIEDAVKNAVETTINEKMQSAEVQAQILDNVNKTMQSETIKQKIEATVSEQMNSDAVKNKIKDITDNKVAEIIANTMGSEDILKKLEEASAGLAKISELKSLLDSYNLFNTSLNIYTAGVDKAAQGSNQLKGGAANIKAGTEGLKQAAEELYNGILQIKDGTPALIDGVSALKDGAMTLSGGLKELNEKGIHPIINAVNGDLKGLVTRIKATVDVSKDYTSFAGKNDAMSGQVKFIYRTEAVKEKEK